MGLELLTHFFGWCLVINLILLAISSISIIFYKDLAMGFHKKMFDVDDAFLTQSYFNYLARFKMMIIVFNLTPYLVLHFVL
ncbi:MAG: DUF6868 family protein [Pseudomonadota bacterium]